MGVSKKNKPIGAELHKKHVAMTNMFGHNVKKIMKSKGMTQARLGSKTGLSQSFISKVIAGTVRINLVDAITIAEVLGQDVTLMADIPVSTGK